MFSLSTDSRNKSEEVIHIDDFVVVSKVIESSKACVPFIKGYVRDTLKDDGKDAKDYYFAYTYQNSVLNFLMVRSHAHVANKLPALAKAFLVPGVYCYKAGKSHHMLIHSEEGVIEHLVHSPLRLDAEDISELVSIEGKIPKTLYLQWSMADNSYNLYPYVGAAFLLALLYWLFQANSYSGLSDKAREKKAELQHAQVKPLMKGAIPDFSALLDETADKLKRQDGTMMGRLLALRADGQKMTIECAIVDENDARNFIKRNGGGSYSDGKVTVTLGEGVAHAK